MSVAEAEADEAPSCRHALARRPGCAALAISTGRLTLLWAAVLVMAGCSELLTAS